MSRDEPLMWMADEARRLHAAGKVRGKSWSLTQVCEHLALAVEGTSIDPDAISSATIGESGWNSLGPFTKLKRRVMKHGLLLSGRFPQGVPSPDFVLPTASTEEGTGRFEEMVQRLAAAAERFDAKVRRADARWVNHPLLGPMTGAQWRRFHTLHARHHFEFMR